MGSVKFTVLCKTGFAIKGVIIVVMRHIATQTENNVMSKIPVEYAKAVIAKPTVPLPFNKVAIAKPCFYGNLQMRVPIYPPKVLLKIPATINIISKRIACSKD